MCTTDQNLFFVLRTDPQDLSWVKEKENGERGGASKREREKEERVVCQAVLVRLWLMNSVCL